jgi:hypothetical protein
MNLLLQPSAKFLIWWLAIRAIIVATSSAAPVEIYPCHPDLDGRRSGLPPATGIYLTNSVSQFDGSKNLGDAAEQLMSGMRATHYLHKTHADRTSGVYDMDCSGFVDYLLKHLAPAQFAQLGVEPGHARPRAAMYFQLFNRLRESPLPGWEAVAKLRNARRGDLLAWQLTPSTQEPGDTGHVVVIAAAPVEQANGLYRVEIFDSSVIHHDDDSRPEGTNGIGKGVITIRADAHGKPIGFQFNSRAHFHLEPIAIGRLLTPSGDH